YHPHIHCILLVDKHYFSKKNKKYIDQPRWQHLWKTSAKLDYDPIVDIRKVRGHTNHKAVAEVAKYTTKDTDYLKPHNEKLTDSIVTTLTEAFYHKRLYAYGGVMKVIARELDALTPDEGDLISIDNDIIRDDVAFVIEVYRWAFGASNYIRRR
ncbi:MAG: protein rep, partial [Candidatus Bathyarchaeota archaeon]|nr:protein rep [Candidatus Termitimicrobium sp.]